MQLIPLRYFYGINCINADYEQSLIDAAYSLNVYIYGMILIAEYDQSMTDAVYSVDTYNNGLSCINQRPFILCKCT